MRGGLRRNVNQVPGSRESKTYDFVAMNEAIDSIEAGVMVDLAEVNVVVAEGAFVDRAAEPDEVDRDVADNAG